MIKAAFTALMLLAVNGAASAATYSLTVSNGLGSGVYSPGDLVVVTAGAAPATNYIFDQWRGSAKLFASQLDAQTTLTMPSNNVTIAAIYRPIGTNAWNVWADGRDGVPAISGQAIRLSVDGTDLYFSAATSGVWRASLATRQFTHLPTNGLSLRSPANPTGLDITDILSTPQGTLIMTCGAGTNSSNLLALHYWFDTQSNVWRTATYINKSYPYTQRSTYFAVAPDGSVWNGSGFFPYVYRSTDGGKTYTAFNLDALVPTNYFPNPITGITTFGKIYSVEAGPDGSIYAGTETAGYLRSTNNGLSWLSLDPNFTNSNSTNSLGRVGNASGGGFDRFGRVLLETYNPLGPAGTAWGSVMLAGYDPLTAGEFNASIGLAQYLFPGDIVLTANGENFMFTIQNTNNTGGVYRSSDGTHWTQFNTGITVLNPPIFGNLLADAISVSSNRVYVAPTDGRVWCYDTIPQTDVALTLIVSNVVTSISRSSDATMMHLESTTDLSAHGWTAVMNDRTFSHGRFHVTLPLTTSQRLFRLSQ